MQVIIRRGEHLTLMDVLESQLEEFEEKSDEIITEFSFTEEEKQKIYGGCILNKDLTISETEARINSKKNEYKNKRVNEYPTIGDQLDAFWKWFSKIQPTGTEADSMYEKIQGVKTKYPKTVL